MPTFCRHNRFIERCPICSKTLPGQGGEPRVPARGGAAGRRAPARGAGARPAARRSRATDVRVYVDGRRRGLDDGYACELVPGLRSSHDARRLLEEVSFAAGRLEAMAQSPPDAYARAAQLGGRGELERASWLCFLIAYLSPLESDDPFEAIDRAPTLEQVADVPDESIEALALGPRTCHRPGAGAATLRAFLAWAQRVGSLQEALTGEASWSPERRFELVFERMAIHGFPRWGRYELLVTLSHLGLCELRADALHLAAAPAPRGPAAARPQGAATGDPVLAAAKRVFGIGDALLIERRAQRLAAEMQAPLEALDLALFNWFAPQRASLGFPAASADERVREHGTLALGL